MHFLLFVIYLLFVICCYSDICGEMDILEPGVKLTVGTHEVEVVKKIAEGE